MSVDGKSPWPRRVHRATSLLVAGAALVLLMTRADPSSTWQHVRSANWAWVIAGFVFFYASIPARGWRWHILLKRAGSHVGVVALMGTIYRAWTINCVLPSRSGDVFAALTLKTERGLSASHVLGTILAARVLDVGTLVTMVLALFLIWTSDRGDELFSIVGGSAALLGLVLLVGLTVLRRSPQSLVRFLPQWAERRYREFQGSTFRALRQPSAVLGLSVVLWLLECVRLWCVLAAFDAPRPIVEVGFFALAAAVLTGLPITPGGLGTVELFYQQALPLIGVEPTVATAVALVDRALNYWFILITGGVVLLWRRRG